MRLWTVINTSTGWNPCRHLWSSFQTVHQGDSCQINMSRILTDHWSFMKDGICDTLVNIEWSG